MSEAALHLAARIHEPVLAEAPFALAEKYVPGAQSTADYAMAKPVPPMLAFGYGIIDADEISSALRRFGNALERLG